MFIEFCLTRVFRFCGASGDFLFGSGVLGLREGVVPHVFVASEGGYWVVSSVQRFVMHVCTV